jgi:hypothetical protein
VFIAYGILLEECNTKIDVQAKSTSSPGTYKTGEKDVEWAVFVMDEVTPIVG